MSHTQKTKISSSNFCLLLLKPCRSKRDECTNLEPYSGRQLRPISTQSALDIACQMAPCMV